MFMDCIHKAFDRATKGTTIENVIIWILCCVFSLIFAVSLVHRMDLSPAVFDDYQPLNSKLLEVQDNPSIVLSEPGTLIVEPGLVEYTVENEQCKMTGIYTHDFELLDKKQQDKRTHPFWALLGGIFAFLIALIVSYILCFVVMLIVDFIVFLIIEIVNKHKSKKQLENPTT